MDKEGLELKRSESTIDDDEVTHLSCDQFNELEMRLQEPGYKLSYDERHNEFIHCGGRFCIVSRKGYNTILYID